MAPADRTNCPVPNRGSKMGRQPVNETPVSNVDRYIDAQNQPHTGFALALAEIRAGGKQGHWIWYVFPQIAGLGRSGLSLRYAIADLPEARAYLQNSGLRSRLLAITAAVAEQARRRRPLTVVMGSSIDVTKLGRHGFIHRRDEARSSWVHPST